MSADMLNSMKLKFAEDVGAKEITQLCSEKLRRYTYFRLGTDTYLIVKASSGSPFFGFGKKYVDLFDKCTEEPGTFYLVCIDSQSSGWLISKVGLARKIHNGLGCSKSTGAWEYKINKSDIHPQERFDSINDCRAMMTTCI